MKDEALIHTQPQKPQPLLHPMQHHPAERCVHAPGKSLNNITTVFLLFTSQTNKLQFEKDLNDRGPH